MRNFGERTTAGGPRRAWLDPGAASGRVRSFLGFTNYAKTTLLLGALTALVVLAADWLGGTAWAIGALVFMGAMNLASWYWSHKIVIAMHRARPLAYEEAPHVHHAVERLARRAGVPAPSIYYVPDRAPNAFATGRNPRHAVVAVTHGLLEILDPDEVEGVLAHELAHVLNRDVLISTVAATLAGAVTLVARIAGWGMMLGGFGSSSDDDRPNPIAALLLILLAPLVALIIQLAVSRSREYGADAVGARLAGSPRGLARALEKLHLVSKRVPMRTADPATSHLYIVAPLLGLGGRLVNLFSTHPPVEERIRRLYEMRG